MTIRFAKEEDIPQLLILCKAHVIFEKANFNTENKHALFKTHLFKKENAIQCIVVEKDESLLGYATFMKQFSTWDADFYVYLDCLFLKEETRGKGIGTTMMNHVAAYARKENCTHIQWQTPDFNTSAIRFYKKLGTQSKSKERFFWEV
ncbi:GNAT family N-acetyltransferase [Aquimarina pacifica]|uniref:GNAT family N-acetyltransferase n=1 Tax=Aquimarina pacifica TaxID=1296415 RepID=UPI000472EB54|nr:GNAT family N-acetyltransferase [Aquimarina pacifica]